MSIRKDSVDKICKRLEREMKLLAARRDAIDNLISDAEQLRDDTQEALDALETARDALSRLV